MRIPENKIEEIRNSINILDVISAYVQLRKRGKNFIGLCPFHQEKTPSFTVSEEKQIYHCFGCGNGGNIFKFLMEYKNISFIEAVQEAAEQAGIKISLEDDAPSKEQSEQEILYDLNVLAARYFSSNLLSSSDGEIARQYFKRRNIKLQTQKIFGLGFARPEWEDLLFYLKDNKVDLLKALQLGLIDKRDDGSYYDKFRSRIIFPIFSPNGRVIAFGGRVLDASANTAKYLNSPESVIYSKRRSLYGLYHSKEEIRKLNKVILVEGYMDLISLFQHGIKNVVASSGTSLTEEQVQLLSRFTKNIIVLYDSDSAGENAAMRSIEILLKQNFDVKIVSLPDKEDPDSFINNYGVEEFEEQIDKAKNFLEYQTEQYQKKGMLEDPVKQAEAIRELVKSASLVNDELKRSLLIKSISKRFNLREKLIESELDKYLQQLSDRAERFTINRAKLTIDNTSSQAEMNSSITHTLNSFEKEIVSLMFEGDKQILDLIFDHIKPDELLNPVFKDLASIVYDSFLKSQISPSSIIDKIEDEKMRRFVFSIALNHESISRKWDELNHNGKIKLDLIEHASHLITNYQLKRIDELIKHNNSLIAQTTDDEKIIKLLNKIKQLQTEKKNILAGSSLNK